MDVEQRSSLVSALGELGRPTVAVVGDLMLDRYQWGTVDRISPEAPIQVLAVTQQDVRIGNAGCVLSNLAMLNATCLAVGVLGSDEAGDTFRGILSEKEISDALIVVDNERPTSLKTRLIARTQQLLRVDQEETAPFSPEIQAKLAQSAVAAAGRADIVLVSDCGKGVVCRPVMEALVEIAAQRDIMVLVDPSRDHDYAMYRGATLLTPNRAEAGMAAGFPVNAPCDFAPAARTLIAKADLDSVVITLDKDGIFCMDKNGSGKLIPTQPRAVFDVTGAGDMVLSMLGLALSSKLDLATAVELANLAAGIEVQKLGAAPVTAAELIEAASNTSHRASSKIFAVDDLERRLDERRRRGERIVFTNGCFDILHVGHVEYFSFCRKQGDVLVVGLNSDSSVRRLKGPHRPYQTESERARILAALSDVDCIALFDEDTPLNLIKRVRPDVLVKGEDWRDKGVVGREFVEDTGGSVVLCPMTKDASSTNIIQRIQKGADLKEPATTAD